MSSPRRQLKEIDVSAREQLALNLIRLRAAKGWSQEALALESGLHRTFVGHLERLHRNASIDNVERLARALGVPIRDLFAPIFGDRSTDG
ncbi:helix-turn-helix transcriptional regulator [Roseateles chitinivorans]|uniref:helix-turn-helix transcriptional regulator n=1 Tax=Roseateles chitinivorans TaxID=2917965 RepID=UPI002AA2A1E3|nr:helix-turn-helix transcriptional regulator [uncultured Roseateles sp.]